MADDTPDQTEQKSAVILGGPAFEQLRKKLASQTRKRSLARAAGKMAMQKRLFIRMLNKDRERPHLRVIK